MPTPDESTRGARKRPPARADSLDTARARGATHAANAKDATKPPRHDTGAPCRWRRDARRPGGHHRCALLRAEARGAAAEAVGGLEAKAARLGREILPGGAKRSGKGGEGDRESKRLNSS